MANSDFGCGLRNAKDAAQFYYKKSIKELSEREIIELDLMIDAPSLYNPIISKAKLDEKVNEIMNQKDR